MTVFSGNHHHQREDWEEFVFTKAIIYSFQINMRPLVTGDYLGVLKPTEALCTSNDLIINMILLYQTCTHKWTVSESD